MNTRRRLPVLIVTGLLVAGLVVLVGVFRSTEPVYRITPIPSRSSGGNDALTFRSGAGRPNRAPDPFLENHPPFTHFQSRPACPATLFVDCVSRGDYRLFDE
jgi:hypothetical protein